MDAARRAAREVRALQPSPGMEPERRRSHRLVLEVPVSWRRAGKYLDMATSDISLHGMALATAQTIPDNHLMDLLVFLPTGLVSMLVVSRHDGEVGDRHGIGVTIQFATPEDVHQWADFYHAVERLQGRPAFDEVAAS